MNRVLVFDFDGVLADTLDEMLRYAKEVCDQLEHSCEPIEPDLDALERMEFDVFGRRLGIPEERVEELTKRCFELLKSPQEPLRIFDRIDDVIAQLPSTSKIGIVSGNTSEVVQDFLKHKRLEQYVDIVMAVEDTGSRSEKILKVAVSTGKADSEIYMLGDAVSDIRAAREANVHSVVVTWGLQSWDKVEQARPDYVVHSPGDLLRLFGGG